MKSSVFLGFAVWGPGCIALTACSQALVMQESRLAQAQEVRCRQVTPTGSHMSRRVCTTRAEREAQSAQAQAELENAMEHQRNRTLMERSERREPHRP
jgi:hypothetical protein